jgi:ATP-dependent helicase HrpB
MMHEGAALAAILSEKDFLPQQSADRTAIAADSDLIVRLIALEKADGPAAQQVRKARDEFLRFAPRGAAPHPPPNRDQMLLRLALEAYPDRVCKRRATDPMTALSVGGSGVRLANESAVRKGEFFLAVDARYDHRSVAREALVNIASLIQPHWLEELFPHSIRRESGAEFDSQRQRVVGFNRIWYLDLLLREDRDSRK